MSQKKRYTKAEIKAQIKEKKRMKALAVQRNVTVFALLVMLILGLVSTTFSAFISTNTGESGSLVADIQTLALNQGNKDQVANLGANAEITETGADTYYLAGTMNGWNTTSTPMTQGTDTNGQTFYYSGYYSNQEQFKVVKNGSTWLGSNKNSSSIYPNSLSMYEDGSYLQFNELDDSYYITLGELKEKGYSDVEKMVYACTDDDPIIYFYKNVEDFEFYPIVVSYYCGGYEMKE